MNDYVDIRSSSVLSALAHDLSQAMNVAPLEAQDMVYRASAMITPAPRGPSMRSDVNSTLVNKREFMALVESLKPSNSFVHTPPAYGRGGSKPTTLSSHFIYSNERSTLTLPTRGPPQKHGEG